MHVRQQKVEGLRLQTAQNLSSVAHHCDGMTPFAKYPDREDLRVCRQPLPGGWFVATNINNILKRTIIKLAAEVAGLSFGKDVIVEF